jgi:redox-sensitive bicupin YhaK (pirin superfamily)
MSGIDLVIAPREKDLGGFVVKRLLPYAKRRQVGPWLFFDHFGPMSLRPGQESNVRPHPHINLATVTYLFEGAIRHRDSVGSDQMILPGEVNLMVAGSGIVHSERDPDGASETMRPLHGLQLWHALPEADEEMAPAFFHYKASEIPTLEVKGVKVRILMGKAYGLSSQVKTFAETLYVEAKLEAGQSLELPPAPERALYIVSGHVKIAGQGLEAHSMAILTPEPLIIKATQATQIALIGGEPFTHRHIYWNFVSSRQDRIEQAKSDWREGRFPKVPGDEIEFIPLPAES